MAEQQLLEPLVDLEAAADHQALEGHLEALQHQDKEVLADQLILQMAEEAGALVPPEDLLLEMVEMVDLEQHHLIPDLR